MYSTNTIVSNVISCGTSSVSTSNGTINLNNIYSSTLSISSGSSGTIAISYNKQTFYVKGQEVEVEHVYNSEYYALVFSMISLFGYQGYETMKMNGFKFDKKVEDRLKTIFRDEKIASVLEK